MNCGKRGIKLFWSLTNTLTFLSAPGCQALHSSLALCAITPCPSQEIHCQVKVFASFSDNSNVYQTHVCVCGANCWIISEDSHWVQASLVGSVCPAELHAGPQEQIQHPPCVTGGEEKEQMAEMSRGL